MLGGHPISQLPYFYIIMRNTYDLKIDNIMIQGLYIIVFNIFFSKRSFISFKQGIFFIKIISSGTCYIGQRNINGHEFRWYETTSDPCLCSRLDIISDNDGDIVVSTDNIDNIRKILHLTCNTTGLKSSFLPFNSFRVI